MKRKIHLSLIFFLVILSCSNENSISKKELTITNFEKYLKSDMSYNAIVETFGKPSKDVGSGIHIYVYILTDTSEVWIGFTDKILYAKHIDINRKITKDIIFE